MSRAGLAVPNTDARGDLQVTLYLAQSLLASGQWSAALDHYRFAAQAFVARREPHNALAAYLLAAKLVPTCLATQGVVAGLLHKLGRSSEALARLDQLAVEHAARGEYAAAVHLYRLALEIDPHGAQRRVWAAELLVSSGDHAGALQQLEAAAESFGEQRRVGELLWVAARIAPLRAGHIGISRIVARALLEVRDLRRAVQWLRYLMSLAPGDVAGRELLARCYGEHGNVRTASHIYRLLGLETRQRGIGHCDEALRLLECAVQWNAADAQAASALRALKQEIAEIARFDFSEEAATGLMLDAAGGAPVEQERTNIVRFPLPGVADETDDLPDYSGDVIFAAFG